MSAPDPYPRSRLFVEQPLAEGASAALQDKQAHYLLHVLRLREGDAVALFNGRDGEWLGTLESARKKSADIRLRRQTRPQRAAPDVWLCFAPVKHGRIDFLAQKAAELGASRLWPVMTRRTAVSRVNLERLRAGAVEAAEQSERLDVPDVMEPVTLSGLLERWVAPAPTLRLKGEGAGRILIYADETGGGALPQTLLPSLAPAGCAVLTGPEGGFGSEELESLRAAPFARAMTLGPRILRADTAALAALTLVMAWHGGWEERPSFRRGEQRA